MACLRCSICSTSWPVLEDFKECPHCELPTSPVSNIKAMPKAEAFDLKRHEDFERFYQEWDESHPKSRLSTEGLRAFEPEVPAQPGTALARVV
jgi:hypothetical protein